MIEFTALKKSKKSNARLGVLKTPHGIVETPTLVPVATQAAVKTLTSDAVAKTKSQILIANTFHLHLKPGEDVVKVGGGLHKFMRWDKPLMTDSGGFQVFSLGFGMDFGVGKIAKQKKNSAVHKGAQPKSLKIIPEGVIFRSPLDGKELFLGPRESMKIQEKLGADIIFAFDECTPPIADHEYTKKSLVRTHRWARICLETHATHQALYGIVQGGKYKDLRIQSAREIGSLPFPGFGIGGEFGDNKRTMISMLRWVLEELPETKPRHLLGIGHPEDILDVVRCGVDTFDCTLPTHYARHGIAFVKRGRLDMNKAHFLKDTTPLDASCNCMACSTYTKSYISHLIRAKEITGLTLLTFHNLYFFNTVLEHIRSALKAGRL